MSKATARIVICGERKFWWELQTHDGDHIAEDPGTFYPTREEAKRAALRAQKLMASAEVQGEK